MNLLSLNGRWYNVLVPKSEGLTRDVDILDGPNAERAINGAMNFDTIGTFYNYTYKVNRDPEHFSDYDDLHKELRNPRSRDKLISVPFDQGYATYRAYISSISDTLTRVSGGKNYWDGMSIRLVAVEANEDA